MLLISLVLECHILVTIALQVRVMPEKWSNSDLQIVDPDFTDFLEKLVDLPPRMQMASLMVIALLHMQHPPS